ncbi:DUF1707 domain-containing protein [Corynebacterium mastitidis]|uniref:DUF1707 domain-containing protein n=1 Tax=Corynebacterium mastitidis TaxID=161890 RepID=A0ABU8NXT5_9CORY
MSGQSDGDAAIRVGDRERGAALESLTEYFVRGFIDAAEFEERTGRAAAARTRGEVSAVLGDLPELAPEEDEHRGQRELDSLLKRGYKIQSIDAVAGTVATAALLSLLFLSWGWLWAVVIGALALPYVWRALHSYSDEDEEIFSELQEEEKKRRSERLRVAARRRRELGA